MGGTMDRLLMRPVLFSVLDHKNIVIRSSTSLFASVTQPPPLPTFLHSAAKSSSFFFFLYFFPHYVPGFSTYKQK